MSKCTVLVTYPRPEVMFSHQGFSALPRRRDWMGRNKRRVASACQSESWRPIPPAVCLLWPQTLPRNATGMGNLPLRYRLSRCDQQVVWWPARLGPAGKHPERVQKQRTLGRECNCKPSLRERGRQGREQRTMSPLGRRRENHRGHAPSIQSYLCHTLGRHWTIDWYLWVPIPENQENCCSEYSWF